MRSTRRLIFIVTLALLMIGVVMVYSSSAIYAHEKFGNSAFFLKKHLWFLLIGFTSMLFAMSVKLSDLEKYARPLLLISILFLIAVLVPGIGSSISGARRWFKVGFLSFQPSELAKFTLIIYLASFLSRKGYKIKDLLRGYIPCISIIGLMCGLVLLQPDLGTAVSIFFIGFLIIFVAGGQVKHLLLTALTGLPFLHYLLFSVPYRRRRLLTFLNPWADKEGTGFQIIQSFLALGTGGLFGLGLGQSKQKLFYLPESHTDFIFSIIGEELGFIGASCIIVLFGVFIWLGMRAFFNEHRTFNKTLIFGITGIIAFEALVNIGVSTGVFPTKGLPLPFISYGGSSLAFHMGAVGLMLNAMRDS